MLKRKCNLKSVIVIAGKMGGFSFWLSKYYCKLWKMVTNKTKSSFRQNDLKLQSYFLTKII